MEEIITEKKSTHIGKIKDAHLSLNGNRSPKPKDDRIGKDGAPDLGENLAGSITDGAGDANSCTLTHPPEKANVVGTKIYPTSVDPKDIITEAPFVKAPGYGSEATRCHKVAGSPTCRHGDHTVEGSDSFVHAETIPKNDEKGDLSATKDVPAVPGATLDK